MADEIDEILMTQWERLRDLSHFEHEEIIRFLQDNPDPRSVPHIKEAILLKPHLKYLDYDDYGAYYKKCLWALQEINTPEAIELIRECVESDMPELKAQAKYRLSKIELSNTITPTSSNTERGRLVHLRQVKLQVVYIA